MRVYPYIASSLAVASALNAHAAVEPTTRNNILVIVADDLGKELLDIYSQPVAQRAKTPNIDRLAQRGITFDNVWGAPLSAPVRAAMLTGRHGYKTGIVALDITLPTTEQTIFEALPAQYSNALIGKWHLSSYANFAPDYGIKHFAGFVQGGGVRDYWNWRFTQNGESQQSKEYITEQLTTSAVDWIKSQGEQSWFCWLAYNAPHTPIHLPPSHLHSRSELSGTQEDINNNPLHYHLAMIESLDTEIGRLLECVDDNTTIIFVGDNGTANNVLQSPHLTRHGKGSLYEGGVAIPMVVCGAGVSQAGMRSDAKVSAVDIFPTVMELSGVEMPRYEDGYSFAEVLTGGKSERAYNFAEIIHQRFGYMNSLSDGQYKVISTGEEVTMMFDLNKDPYEQNNLMQGGLNAEQKSHLTAMQREIKGMNIDIKSLPKTTNTKGSGNRPNQTQMRWHGQGQRQRQ